MSLDHGHYRQKGREEVTDASFNSMATHEVGGNGREGGAKDRLTRQLPGRSFKGRLFQGNTARSRAQSESRVPVRVQGKLVGATYPEPPRGCCAVQGNLADSLRAWLDSDPGGGTMSPCQKCRPLKLRPSTRRFIRSWAKLPPTYPVAWAVLPWKDTSTAALSRVSCLAKVTR